MSDRQKLLAAILTALPALLLACTAWVNAQAKAAETRAAYEGYGDYVTDQLRRDEAILQALQDCQERLSGPKSWHDLAEGPLVAMRAPEGAVAGVAKGPQEPQAQAVLDEIARSRGWE